MNTKTLWGALTPSWAIIAIPEGEDVESLCYCLGRPLLTSGCAR